MDDQTYPEHLRYDLTHAWVRSENGEAVVGLASDAGGAWGEAGFVQLPQAGQAIRAGEAVGQLSCAGAGPCDLIAPLSGSILTVNDALTDEPSLVNTDPYGEGWLYRLALSDPAELRDLLDAGEYRQAIAATLPDPTPVLGPVFHNSVDAMVLLDEHRRVLAMNPAAEALTGYQAERVAGASHCYHLFRCEAGGCTLHGVECAGMCTRPGTPARVHEFTITRVDGTPVPVSATYSPIPRPDGEGVFLLITLRTRHTEEQ